MTPHDVTDLPIAELLPGRPPDLGANPRLDGVEYVEREFVVRGVATSYEIDDERGADGRWDAVPATAASYVSRILVRQPADAARFSGTIVVEWLNVSAGADGWPDWGYLHRDITRRGHGWVGVSAQRAGISGGGLMEGPHLKKEAPERYAPLDHPGDPWSFDIFSQAGRALRAPDRAGLLDSIVPERLLAVGESQSAIYLVTYVNAVDPVARVFDGFLLHGREIGRAHV